MTIKQTILIIAVLITGFLAGFLTAGHLAKKRFRHLVEKHQPQTMPGRLLDIIAPDEEQIVEVEPILQKYADSLHNIRRAHRKELRRIHDSMHRELRPQLSSAQIERLEKARKPDFRKKRKKKRNKKRDMLE